MKTLSIDDFTDEEMEILLDGARMAYGNPQNSNNLNPPRTEVPEVGPEPGIPTVVTK